MELWLHRDTLTAAMTLGKLYVNGVYQCEVCEDTFRGAAPKVPGRTCIPNGRYPVTLTQSPRFGRVLPMVNNVPGFQGIRIHPGNTPDDTEGCLLPGLVRSRDGVLESRKAFDALFAVLALARTPIHLTISLEPPPIPLGAT